MPLSIVFMGTPDFAVPTLEAVLAAGHRVTAVYTQPARPAGRGMSVVATPVEQAARRHGLDIRTPVDFRDGADVATLAATAPDVIVVVAYGLLLPPAVLAIPRYGCLNLHASLLPRWRGAAPIHRAVMAGDEEVGVMVMRMERGLDTGPVAMSARSLLSCDDTTGDLHDRLKIVGAGLMVDALRRMEAGTLSFAPQADAGILYAHKIDKGETRIDWAKPASVVRRHVHGLSPFPGAWCEIMTPQGTERLKILRCEYVDASGPPATILDDRLAIACAEGAVRPLLVQRAGRKVMDSDTALRGLDLAPGMTVR